MGDEKHQLTIENMKAFSSELDQRFENKFKRSTLHKLFKKHFQPHTISFFFGDRVSL